MYDFYDYQNNLAGQPEFFIMDPEQHVAIVATPLDGLIINMKSKEEFDID